MEKEIRKRESVTLETAVERIRACTPGLPAETKKLSEVQGEVLCGAVMAIHDQPPFARSPLDGYAFHGDDSKGADENHPVRLTVIDKLCAGDGRTVRVKKGECVRIMTGAPIPDGADAVIRQEDTDEGEDFVRLYRQILPWENYCCQGEDYKAGTALLADQTKLDYAAIGLLASNGIEAVKVYPKPRVVVLATGDELLEPGEALKPGKIYNSNLYMIKARLKEWGIDSVTFHIKDSQEAVKLKITESLMDADAVITTGGVSVGEKDILNQVLRDDDMELLFDGLDLKPGSPAKYALYRNKPILALSGNPFAALVTLELLARPMLETLMHQKPEPIRYGDAVLLNQFPKASKGRRLIRGRYRNGEVTIPESHSSGQLSSMLGCNCLIDIPKGSGALEAGAPVKIIML